MLNWRSGVNLKVTLAVNSASKLEGALLLATRCQVNTSSEHMKSFHICPLDVICWGVNLKVPLAVNLKVTLAVAVNLKVTLALNLKVPLAENLKVTGSGSKLEGALLLVGGGWGGKLELDTSSENMNSFRVLLLHHRGLFYERPIRQVLSSIHTSD